MHFRRRYEICIYSVFGHPRRTWIFSKLQGLQHYYSENFRCNLTFYEREKFSVFLSPLHFLNPNILGFLFLRKIVQHGEWMWKNKVQKIFRKFIRQALKIVHEWNRHLEIFNRLKPIENPRPCLLFRTDILQRQSLGATDKTTSVDCCAVNC